MGRVAFLFERKAVTREQILAAIRAKAKQLGRAPSFREIAVSFRVRKARIKKLFGNYSVALRACGLDRVRGRHAATMEELFKGWAEVARKLGKVPTIYEYETRTNHSLRPLVTRFGGWRRVPRGMLKYAQAEGLVEEWADVIGIVKKHVREQDENQPVERPARRALNKAVTAAQAREQTKEPAKEPVCAREPARPIEGPVYGPPMIGTGMTFGPANEMGVMCLFCMLAWHLGFAVMRIQSEFPDCEAMRRITEHKWQKVRIEFEYESRNFVRHNHPPDGCDVIVCWIHNWPECPLEVVELSKVGFCASCDGGKK
jgi:HNH endonuclease